MSDATISAYVTYQNAQRMAYGWNATWASNMDSSGVSAGGTNSVIGWQNAVLPAGNNTVLLDGPRSEYLVQVDGAGHLAVEDTANGQTITVSGDSYVVFNGASAATPGVYDQMMIISGGGDATIARLYQATFGRMPDLAGLEAWQHQLDAGLMTLPQISQAFAGSTEFQSRYGASTTDMQFVDALYTNVLGRVADKSGETAWATYLGQQTTVSGAATARAIVLQDFATSQEESINSTSWLIDTGTGGHADPGLLLPAATVLSQGVQNGYINIALANVAAIANQSVSAGAIDLLGAVTGVSGTGSLWLNPGAAAATILLSTAVTAVTVDNAGNTIYDSTAADSITINGGTNNSIVLANGGTDTLNLAGGINTSVVGFTPGHGSVIAVSGALNATAVSILDGSHTAVAGSGLSFGTFSASTPIIVNIGNVGGGSAAEVATAANKAYLVADSNGNASSGTLGEHVVFMGTDNSGSTEFWSFQAPLSSLTVNGVSTLGPVNTADLNGNHLVDTNEITHVATLVGVTAASLHAADLA